MTCTRLAALLLSFCVLLSDAHAQKSINLKKVIELQMPEGGGKNGAGVAWHPKQKKYYASFAGNEIYPLAVFAEDGKRLSDDDWAAGFDVRGLWYDPTQKAICGNAYAESGWFMLMLDDKGIPQSAENIVAEMMQPEENSVGLMEATDESVCFLQGQELKIYKSKDSNIKESYRIYAGKKVKPEYSNDEDETDKSMLPEQYNSNVAVYTPQKHAEFGLLNISEQQIELHDKDSGLLSQILHLPKEASLSEMFNFAYANGIYWLFEKDNRKWVGYK
jgi:hypothetical protein